MLTLHQDLYGTMGEQAFAAHGYGAYFCLSTMDRYHNPHGTWQEGLETLKRCIFELQHRFIVDLGKWKVRVITKDGIQEMAFGAQPHPAGATVAADVQNESMQTEQVAVA